MSISGFKISLRADLCHFAKNNQVYPVILAHDWEMVLKVCDTPSDEELQHETVVKRGNPLNGMRRKTRPDGNDGYRSPTNG